MRECVTCHFACDCRERRFKALEREIERLKSEVTAMDECAVRWQNDYAEAAKLLEEAREMAEFYAEKTNWNYDQIRPEDYNGWGGGNRARAFLERLKGAGL